MFALFALGRVAQLFSSLEQSVVADEPTAQLYFWLSIGHQGLAMLFMGLVAGLFLLQRPSLSSAQGRWGDVAAVAGTFVLLTLGSVPITRDGIAIMLVAESLLLVGLAITVAALANLGRCLGSCRAHAVWFAPDRIASSVTRCISANSSPLLACCCRS